MKDEPRKPLEALGDEALEARIVAWVLGEASAFEASELEELCAKDLELTRFADRMREVHQLIGADGKMVVGDEWKLPEEKRRRVVDLLGVEPVLRSEAKKRWRFPTRIVSLMAAACLMGAFVLWGMSASIGGKAMKSRGMVASYEGEPYLLGGDLIETRGFDVADESRYDLRSGVDLNGRDQEARGRRFTPTIVDQPFGNNVEWDETQTSDPFAESGSAGQVRSGSESSAREELVKSGPEARPAEIAGLGDLPALGLLSGGVEVQIDGASPQVAAKPEGMNQWGSKNESDASVDSFFDVNQGTRKGQEGYQLGTAFDSSSDSTDLDGSLWWSGSQNGELAKDRSDAGVAFAGSVGGGASDESLNFYSGIDAERLSLGYADSSDGVDRQDLISRVSGQTGPVAEAEPNQASGDSTELARNEMLLRQNGVAESDQKRDEAREDHAAGRNKEAQQKHVEPMGRLSFMPEFIQTGNFGGVRKSLESAKQGDPENRDANEALAAMNDPVNPDEAGIEGNREILGEIRRDLYEAEGAFELGKFDQAKEKYEEVVQTDPSNTAARRGLERVNAAKSDYYRAAYDETRANLLAEVDETWEMAVPPASKTAEFKSLDGSAGTLFSNRYEVPHDDEVSVMPVDDSETSLAAAEDRLKKVKREVGAPAMIAGKLSKGNDASDKELATLRDAVQKQEDSVEDKRKTLTTILRNQELIYRGLNQSGGREDGLSSDDEAKMAALSFAELTEQKIKLDSQIETLLKYDDDQLMTYASGLQLPENIVRELQPQYLESKRDLDVMKLGGLGDDHPSVIRQKKVVDGMKGEINQSIESLRENLLAQRELAVEQSSRLAEQMAEKKSKAVQQGIGLHGFDDAKQEFETSQKLLEQLKIKLAVVDGKSVSRQEPAKIEISKSTKDNSATLDAMAEISAADEAFSTFSMHVSDASFKLAAAAMARGEVLAAESVRPEEFYNAFDYGDPAPTASEPVACAVEQCAHPAFPQRNLLRIAVRTGSEGRAQSKPLNLTLLLDNSGSMEREDRALGLNRAVEGLTSLLKEGDTITVAGFSRQPRLLADRVDGKDAASLNGLVTQTPAEGGTNLEEALKLGGDLAKRQFKEGAQNRVVLFTDGAANLGDADPESLNGKVEQLRNEGIAFDAAGFGADGLNDRLLERLTRNGNGRYYVVDDASDADSGFAKQLAGAFRPAAENVKVQVVFNPSRVGNYKLIGFEEHRLKKEDFRNDAVDAAEMASEEAGVALYQFEVLPEGQGEVGEVSIRFRDTASGEMVEQSWPIPYDPQAPSFDQAKPGIQLAGIAAFVAEKLRSAPMAEAVDYSELRGVMARVKAEYEGNERVGQLEQMMRR